MKTNLWSNPFRKGISLLLTLLMVISLLPLHTVLADDDTETPSEPAGEEPSIVIRTENGDITPEEDWDVVYPYGTFAFGNYQADVAESGALTADGQAIPESILIPVYRLGGAVGRATVRIMYAPAITTNEDGTEQVFDYAASGKQDVLIEVEDANPIAAYQPLGIPESERNMKPAACEVKLPDAPEDVSPEDELVLTLSGIADTEAEAYRWQVCREDGWHDIEDANSPELIVTWGDIWDFENQEPTGYDFRCLLKNGDEITCSRSMLGEVYEPIADPEPVPEDLVIPDEPTFSTVTFEDDWDIMEFAMTFADGETVKYIRVTAIEDEIPELPEFGLFTISGCEGGLLSDTCNTLTLMVSDNDAHGESTVGFADEAISANREDGFVKAKIARSGDTTYNITVQYETVDGTAVAGVDYAKAEGVLAFAGSIDEIEIPIELIANDATEDKTFEIVLSDILGGGTEDLCKFERERVTVTIMGQSKTPGKNGAGLNLASLLAGTSGSDVSGRVAEGENALIGSNKEPAVTASVAMVAGEDLEAELVLSDDTRSHWMGPCYKFSRSSTSSDGKTSYSNGSYWRDWDDMLGNSKNVYTDIDVAYGGSGNLKKEVKHSTDGDPDEPYLNLIENSTRTHNGVTYTTCKLDGNYRGSAKISWGNTEHKAGEYYDQVSMAFGWVEPGVRHMDVIHNRYLRPKIEISVGDWSQSKWFDVDTDTDNGDWRPDHWDMYCQLRGRDDWNWGYKYYKDPGYVGTFKHGLDGPYLDYGENFSINLSFKYYLAWTHREATTYHKNVTTGEHYSKFDIREVSGHRRTYQNSNLGIGLVLYTVNDEDTAGGYTALPYTSGIYGELSPKVYIKEKEGGVNYNGEIYVGSKLIIDFSNVPGQFRIPNDGVRLLGNWTSFEVKKESDRVFSCILMPDSAMTETIQKDRFTLHVCYDRVQTVKIDVDSSSKRDLGDMQSSPESYMRAFEKMFTDAGKNLSEQQGQQVDGEFSYVTAWTKACDPVVKYTDSHGKTYDLVFTAEAGEPKSLQFGTITWYNEGKKYKDYDGPFVDNGDGVFILEKSVTNLQMINFHQDPEDYIVYNKKAYAGDQDIPISKDDMGNAELVFRFYDSEYLEALSIMRVDIDHVEIYCDENQNGIIEGELNEDNFFEVAKGSPDYLYMRVNGEYPDSTFRPQLDKDGNVIQYIMKVYYTRRPRAYNVPEGDDGDQKAQMLPAFVSAITDPKETEGLTKEQLSYRYMRANNTDDRVMFGAEASGIEYVDIPMGGDIGEVTMDVAVDYAYEADGKTIRDITETKIFTWEPKYKGSLLIPFDAPAQITDTNNVTGGNVDLGGSDPSSAAGKEILNNYLGAFVGRTTFAIGIQEQQLPLVGTKTQPGITTLDEIKPEYVTIGPVRTVPSADNVVNTKNSQSPGATDGTSPDLGSDYGEFKQDLGVELPSMDLSLGDYATIILDGYQVGFAIGIPIFKNEKTEYTSGTQTGNTATTEKPSYKDGDDNEHTVTEKKDFNAKTTTTTDEYTAKDPDAPNDPKKRISRKVIETVDENGHTTYRTETTKQTKQDDGTWRNGDTKITDTKPEIPSQKTGKKMAGYAGDAHGQMQTLGQFISAVGKGQGTNYFKDAFNDDSLDKARNGSAAMKKYSVSFSLQIAIMFEYNPIDNCHYFKNAGLTATLGFEFTLQMRFTPCPVFYLYIKLGVEIEANIGLSCYRLRKEGDPITKFEVGRALVDLSKGNTVKFKLDMRKSTENRARGFVMDLSGDVLMRLYTSNAADAYPESVGLLKGDGGEKEVLLKDYDKEVYVELIPYEGEISAKNLRPIIGAESKVVFDGLTIAPSLSIEAGIGAGIELLKIEAFFKISTSMAMTMGGYLEETDSYEGFYIKSFEGSMAVGINITAAFINYSLDAIAFGFTGEQHGTRGYFSWHISCSAVNGSYNLWSKDCYTSADGKTLPGEPQPPDGVNIFSDNPDMTFYDANGVDLSDKDADPSKSDWTFRTDVLAWRWTGGVFIGEIPQNSDLAEANKDGVSVQFDEKQPQINVYFSGEIEVSSTRTGKTDTYTSSPAKLKFGSGESDNTITITCTEGTKLDRYEIPGRSGAGAGGFRNVSQGNGESLVHISGPTDISKTQRVVVPKEDSRAIAATGTDDFQLSGYSNSGDAKELVTGLATGYDYQLVQAKGENYVVYPLMVNGVPQLVLSRLVMTGNLAQTTGLVHPIDETQVLDLGNDGQAGALLLDTDGFMDTDFDAAESENGLLISWISYGDEKGDVYEVKQREIPLVEGATLADPVVLASGATVSMLAQSTGTETVWVSASGDGSTDNERLRSWLMATHPGLEDEMLNSGKTVDPNLASAVFTWNTQSAINSMSGDNSVLHVKRGDSVLTAAVDGGQHITNMETAQIGSTVYVLYTTSQVAYFDPTAENPEALEADEITADTDQGNFYRLYLRTLDADGFSEEKLLKTVIDFAGCTEDTIAGATLKDGVYSNSSLEKQQLDPYFANLRFINANVDGSGASNYALFEMNGNTWLLKQADMDDLLNDSGSAELIPIFSETTGTEVAIGADEDGNMSIVYTAPVSNSQSNAIFTAWWDQREQKWGTPTILAMRNLQIYEDSIKYDMSPEDTEKAYLSDGGFKTPGGHTGSKDKLVFTNLQMTTRTVESDGNTRKQLIVLTNGAMTELEKHTFEMGEGKEPFKTYIPKPNTKAKVGFYGIAFGAGKQGIDEVTLDLASCNFKTGSTLTGNVQFRNTGTAMLRASDVEPLTVKLYIHRETDKDIDLATWFLTSPIPSGMTADLYFDSLPLTETLSTGDSFYLDVQEYSFEGQGSKPFSQTVKNLLVVEDKPDLSVDGFEASVLAIDGDRVNLKVYVSVVNGGSKTANGAFLQFSYDSGKVDADGLPIYKAVDITGSDLNTSMQEHRGTNDAQNGIYRLLNEKDGSNIDPDYYRSVYGTLSIPKACFIQTETKSGLHLKVEAFSDADTPNIVESVVYTSEHNEYNEINNRSEVILKHETVFIVPGRINTALGTTLTLPVQYATTADASDIVLTEVTDGTEGWEPRMGICYYDAERQVIVAAPNAKAQEMIEAGEVPTGILQLKDMKTNSITAITYKIGAMAEGVNIYRDDTTFTFHEPDDSLTDVYAAAADNPAWLFLDKNVEVGWTGGAEKEFPMNNDLTLANTDGAYFEFNTVADTLTFYFMGELTVQSEAFGVTKTITESPAKIEFRNSSGAQHIVRVTAKKGARIDRFVPTYKVNTVVETDPEAPQILWNRSFPDVASIKTGGSIEMTCYIVDGTGIKEVSLNGVTLDEETTPALVKVNDNLYYFTYTFTKNLEKDEEFTVRACDLSGNISSGDVNVNWFNDVPSTSANSDAPGLLPEHLRLLNSQYKPLEPGVINYRPWLDCTYATADNETVEAHLFQDGTFANPALEQADDAQRWTVNVNGLYLVRVDRDDDTWARAIIAVDCIDVTVPQLSVTAGDGILKIYASDDHRIESLTVNGYPIQVSGASYSGDFPIPLGGEYTVTLKDDAGNEQTETVRAVIPVTFELEKEIICPDGNISGTLSIVAASAAGGDYDPAKSKPGNNVYVTDYEFAAVSGETTEAPTEGWTALTSDLVLATELGTYTVFVRDTAGNTTYQTVRLMHDFAWDVQEYVWTETETGYTVTGTAICTNDASHVVTETVDAVYAVVSPATTRKDGTGRYTATFTDEHFTTQTKDIVLPMLLPTFYGEDVMAVDALTYRDGKVLYRYDVKIKNVDSDDKAVGGQVYIGFDKDTMQFVDAETDLEGETGVHAYYKGVLAFGWASGGDGVSLNDGDVIVSLYFELIKPVADGTVLAFTFPEENNGFKTGLAYLIPEGGVEDAPAVLTEDGSITFAYPEAMTIAGEDVIANDIYVVENGEMLYPYRIRVRDLPEAGLLVNSAQIFINFDRTMLTWRKAEGMVDWTITENDSALMATWASDTEVLLKNEDVILTLWFAGTDNVKPGDAVQIAFTVNPLGSGTELSYLFAGKVVAAEAATVDGSILFEPILYGDANCDGQVTSADAAMILRTLVKLSTLTPRGTLNADVDCDGQITAADAAAILRYLVSLIDALPIS